MSIALLFPPGFKPVIKHGDHDQSSHGNWATGNFDENNEREAAQNTYFDRYGFDKDGKPTGITVDEIDSVAFYIGEGYKYVNGPLRGTGNNPTNPGDEKKMSGIVQNLDKAIEESPDIFGDKNLYRVFSDKVLSTLEPGDVVTDRGYLSTTRIDITQDSDARNNLGNINETRDTVAIILPSESGTGKGLSVDMFANAVSGVKGTASFSSAQADTEKEVLLPRSTPLKFIGYKTDVGNEARVAVFQRMDK